MSIEQMAKVYRECFRTEEGRPMSEVAAEWLLREEWHRLGFPPDFEPEAGCIGKAVAILQETIPLIVWATTSETEPKIADALRLLGREQ